MKKKDIKQYFEHWKWITEDLIPQGYPDTDFKLLVLCLDKIQPLILKHSDIADNFMKYGGAIVFRIVQYGGFASEINDELILHLLNDLDKILEIYNKGNEDFDYEAEACELLCGLYSKKGTEISNEIAEYAINEISNIEQYGNIYKKNPI